jgi:hypothetical protein
MTRKRADLAESDIRPEAHGLDAGPAPSPRALDRIMQGAGNAAVQQLLEGKPDLLVQRQLGLDPRLYQGSAVTAPRDEAARLERARPLILAWLEPQRADIEERARSTSMGFASPAQALTMGGLVAMIREAVPDAADLDQRQIARVVQDWIHVSIPDRMHGGQVSDAEVVGAIQSVLGKPGTIRVERKGSGWMEVTAGGIEIGRDDSAPVDASMTVGWDGSVGASLSMANVKGSFQISPDRTWQASIAFPAAATPAVLNQIAGVFGAADRAARTVAGRVDASGGHVHDVSVDVLGRGLSPVKDAIDTLSSVTDSEHRVSVGVSTSGDFGGSLSVQATVTIRW